MASKLLLKECGFFGVVKYGLAVVLGAVIANIGAPQRHETAFTPIHIKTQSCNEAAPQRPDSTALIKNNKDIRYSIVTPTFPGHFEQNVRFLLTLIRNCDDCEIVQVQFVTSFEGHDRDLYRILTTHPQVSAHARISILHPTNTTLHTPMNTTKLDVGILSLRVGYGQMGVDIEKYLKRTRDNRRWFGKYTHLSVKKWVGAWYAFNRQHIDVVWWLDSEAYLWRKNFKIIPFLKKEWKRPRLFWSALSHYKRNSVVHEVCPSNGSLGVHEVFQARRAHLFSSSFYLVGKTLFREWGDYVKKSYNGRRFVDVFLALGNRESGYILHIIETQLIVYVGGCQSLVPIPDHCRRYQVVEVNAALKSLINPESLYNNYLKDMKYQGQFEHMFKLFNDTKYQEVIKRAARFYELPSFRVDPQYTTCSHFRVLVPFQIPVLHPVLESIASGELGTMAFQTNSDGCVRELLRAQSCKLQLPITCGSGPWNETCYINEV